MTAAFHTRATAMSRDWKRIEQTVKRPGEWRQTPTGFELVTQ